MLKRLAILPDVNVRVRAHDADSAVHGNSAARDDPQPMKRVVPHLAHAPSGPCVGIFWSVDGALVVDRVSLAQAEPYGGCLTSPAGHYELWERWRKMGVARLKSLGLPARIATSEYDEHPRGRVVYEQSSSRFVLYADRRLQSPEIVAALKCAFGIAEVEVAVMSDLHYR